MADLSNLESILATLAAQKTTPAAGAPASGAPAPGAPSTSAAPPTGYSYPQPTSSGSLDVGSAVQPTTSGTVSIQEAIARAKAHAAQNGVASYDRPITYAPHPSAPAEQSDSRRYRGSRSRSPPPARRGGDGHRDSSYNPYRDERREDSRREDSRREDSRREYPQDRSYSPAHRGSGRPDRNNGSFSPRGGRRDRSPPRGGDSDNVEIIMIKAGLVGLIIGRQGENLRRVEADSQCRVQFIAPTNPEDEMRQCKITGAPARRAEAKAAIYKIIDDSSVIGSGGPPRGPGGRPYGGGGGYGGNTPGGGIPPAALKEGEECIQIMVPDRTVGLIIGRGGETIRDLQERSGCHINIVGETKSVNGLRPVNLIGGREATTQAKELIMEIVDSDTRNGGAGPPGGGPGGAPFRHGGGGGYGGGGGGGGYGGPGGPGGGPDRINDSIFVPAEAVGMIIGKGGETIREMQSTTGCKINVSQTPGANENEREIGLIGSRESIERAKLSIEEKVETVRQKNSGGGYGGYGGHGGYGGPGGGGRGGRGGYRGDNGGDDYNGGGGGGGYRQRDYDNGGYGGGRGNSGGDGGRGAPGGGAPGAGIPGQAGGEDPNTDRYAAYGGYAAYVAMWYQALAQQQAAGGGGDAPPPAPGQ